MGNREWLKKPVWLRSYISFCKWYLKSEMAKIFHGHCSVSPWETSKISQLVLNALCSRQNSMRVWSELQCWKDPLRLKTVSSCLRKKRCAMEWMWMGFSFSGVRQLRVLCPERWQWQLWEEVATLREMLRLSALTGSQTDQPLPKWDLV